MMVPAGPCWLALISFLTLSKVYRVELSPPSALVPISTATIPRHKTAMRRIDLSRPFRVALDDGILIPEMTVFDYGCGRGGDLERLRGLCYECDGWDPNFRPDGKPRPATLVNLGFVVNVIESPEERADTLRRAWALAEQVLVVAARLQVEARELQAATFEDGCLTRLGTFQKFYDQQELRAWIEQTLGTRAIPAAPGIFYVFRDEARLQSFLASRFRRRVAVPKLRHSGTLFERHRALLEPLMEFYAWRGRLPESDELVETDAIRQAMGSLKRAFRVVQEATLATEWERIADERAEDLLVHLALARIEGPPAFSSLPPAIQQDIKAFFTSYTRACALAEVVLFSAGNMGEVTKAQRSSPVGKQTGNALYVHVSALSHLPPILRVFEGCARAVVGSVEGANLVKLHRESPQVSYLRYDAFDTDPHPALLESMVVPLQTFRIKVQRYDQSSNPPILHRKETFVAPDYPLREKFARLTAQEERWGLYERPQSIGTRGGWNQMLREKGVELRGHRVVVVR